MIWDTQLLSTPQLPPAWRQRLHAILTCVLEAGVISSCQEGSAAAAETDLGQLQGHHLFHSIQVRIAAIMAPGGVGRAAGVQRLTGSCEALCAAGDVQGAQRLIIQAAKDLLAEVIRQLLIWLQPTTLSLELQRQSCKEVNRPDWFMAES